MMLVLGIISAAYTDTIDQHSTEAVVLEVEFPEYSGLTLKHNLFLYPSLNQCLNYTVSENLKSDISDTVEKIVKFNRLLDNINGTRNLASLEKRLVVCQLNDAMNCIVDVDFEYSLRGLKIQSNLEGDS